MSEEAADKIALNQNTKKNLRSDCLKPWLLMYCLQWLNDIVPNRIMFNESQGNLSSCCMELLIERLSAYQASQKVSSGKMLFICSPRCQFMLGRQTDVTVVAGAWHDHSLSIWNIYTWTGHQLYKSKTGLEVSKQQQSCKRSKDPWQPVQCRNEKSQRGLYFDISQNKVSSKLKVHIIKLMKQ